ncbi:hypothetical protein HNV12_06515 [Methanococcoides sp. SA1]|nr:hypothetical protein [Methanococcoides sp. SA1]
MKLYDMDASTVIRDALRFRHEHLVSLGQIAPKHRHVPDPVDLGLVVGSKTFKLVSPAAKETS